jgi:hypothetical protein
VTPHGLAWPGLPACARRGCPAAVTVNILTRRFVSAGAGRFVLATPAGGGGFLLPTSSRPRRRWLAATMLLVLCTRSTSPCAGICVLSNNPTTSTPITTSSRRQTMKQPNLVSASQTVSPQHHHPSTRGAPRRVTVASVHCSRCWAPALLSHCCQELPHLEPNNSEATRRGEGDPSCIGAARSGDDAGPQRIDGATEVLLYGLCCDMGGSGVHHERVRFTRGV